MMKPIAALLIITALIFTGCGKKKSAPERPRPTFSTYSGTVGAASPETGKKEISYGLLTPTEVIAMFNKLGVPRDNSVVNPSSNAELYTSNSKAALNLGVYGVDFGYIKMFGFGQQMIDYVLTIREVSNKLGIPDNLLIEPLKKIDGEMSDTDSLMHFVNKSYTDIEAHLRKDGRESTAGLMLMGGWIEALYITTQLLYNPQNPDSLVVEKIAQQKYTLTSLLGFMRNYYDDPVVVFYTKKLIFLKRYFDTFEIYFKKGDLEIDTTKKVIKATGSDMTVSAETLNNIREYVYKLRNEIVSP
jgi:hypothetical protein